MGRSAVSVREEVGGSALLDRRPKRCGSNPENIAAGRWVETAGDGPFLPAVGLAEEKQATAQCVESEVDLHELWFALSRHDQEQFGGHFARMLLRIVRLQTKSASSSLESTS